MSDLGVWGKPTSPYHQGELALHKRYGRLEEQTSIARHVHSPTLDAHQQGFLTEREYVVIGSIDAAGRPWASMLFGDPGFINSPNVETIIVGAQPLPSDRLLGNLAAGSPMSVVAIDLSTRRRIRSNVTLTSASERGLELHVDQAYGNCPKYIQTREVVDAPANAVAPNIEAEVFSSFTDRARAIISEADTFFVSSYNNEDDQHDVGGVDVNHRGGRAGFVRIDGDSLIVPDFMGNFAFNTLGNFVVNPVAGLLFVDFESGDVLQLTGRTEILWEGDPELDGMAGAQRGWKFHLVEGSIIPGAIPVSWTFGDYSPASLRTGTWER